MTATNTILSLPLPPLLHIPLPADSALICGEGVSVAAGETLARGRLAADVVAPAAGVVGKISRRVLAAPAAESAPCVSLHLAVDSPLPPLTVAADDMQTLLRKAGIVGLGGGAFPAWRKYRPQSQLLLINAVASDDKIHGDRALLSRHAATLSATAAHVAAAMGVPSVIIALRDDAPAISKAEGPVRVVRVTADYAMGSERLLIRHLCRRAIPPDEFPADHGILCFNLGTVLAIAAAIDQGIAMTGRIITVRSPANEVINVHVPFGVAMGALAAFAGISPAAKFCVGEGREWLSAEAIICAQTTVADFAAAAADAISPCIRCGACLPICPVDLSPLQLYALWQDGGDGMEENGIAACLLCRRCDEQCPSNIPLAATFAAAQQSFAARRAKAQQASRWQKRHGQHLQRVAATPPLATVSAADQAAAAMRQAKAKRQAALSGD